VDEFQISAGSDTACPKDKIEIKDGDDAAEKFCVNKTYGADVKAAELPIKAETEMSVKLTTDAMTGRGFKLVCKLFGAIPPGI
jgi:hypothetical protein